MISKSILSLIIFLITVFITYSITTGGINSGQFFTLNPKSTSSPPPLPCHTLSPLKIYMYNLPTKFNIGLMKKTNKKTNRFTENNDTLFSVNVSNVPAWPDYAGLHLQHSVEYWMMTSLLVGNGSGWEGREVVRVWDGESADVYFVPFFSSLSFNTFGKNMTDPDNEFDRQLQVDMLKFLRKSVYWQRSAGRDHVIPMHHPNAFRFLRDQVNASILIVADFGRYSKTMANLRKDVVAPYMHVVKSFIDDNPPNPFKLRTTLLFFRGRTVRKSEGKVRRQLEKILKGVTDVHFEASFATGEGINASTQGMRSSKFCLHPAGDTPSSNRLFDAIVSHCVPVIISDHIELPFESELDYTEFSLFFSIKEALIPGNIVEHLRKIPEKKWLKMWKWLKEITHHYEYQFPPKKDDAVNMIWRQVRTKVPAEKLAVNRIRRLKIPDWW